MARGFGLAAARLGDPGILILDEPVNGLDPEGISSASGWARSSGTRRLPCPWSSVSCPRWPCWPSRSAVMARSFTTPLGIARNSLVAVKPVAGAIGPWQGLLVMCAYAVAALTVGCWALTCCDA
jgi:hypothetical protein